MKTHPFVLFATLLATPWASPDTREPRCLLERQTGAIDLPRALAGADAFRPYPTVADRAAWTVIPEARRNAFVAEAERQLATEWAILPATRFLDYVRDGDRGRYEGLLFSRRGKLALLVLGELVDGRGRFTDAIGGGHNAQSHNHNDVGNVIVFADGRPVLVDVGVGEYTAKTFSSRRYEIWTMQSAWHNLPAINGVDQGAGAGFRAADVTFSSRPGAVRLSLDIAPAYPPEAKVARWRREVTLDRRKREVVLAEDYALAEAREPVRLHFITPLAGDLSKPGRIVLAPPGGGPVLAGGEPGPVLLYDAGRFTARIEERAVTDSRLRPVWGGRLYRIVLTPRDRSLRGSHRMVIRAGR